MSFGINVECLNATPFFRQGVAPCLDRISPILSVNEKQFDEAEIV